MTLSLISLQNYAHANTTTNIKFPKGKNCIIHTSTWSGNKNFQFNLEAKMLIVTDKSSNKTIKFPVYLHSTSEGKIEGESQDNTGHSYAYGIINKAKITLTLNSPTNKSNKLEFCAIDW